MKLSTIQFGSLWAYSPRGSTLDERRSRTMVYNLKQDIKRQDGLLMSEYVANGIKNDLKKLPFADFFNARPIIIPTPNSSLTKANTLWVSQHLATAFVKYGLGEQVSSCLHRTKSIRKSHTSSNKDRPKAQEHYDSMSVQKELSEPTEILLVDDIITRGATLIGAANKLADAFPTANIRVFAIIKTISDSSHFNKIYDPCVGEITLRNDGETFNRCIN